MFNRYYILCQVTMAIKKFNNLLLGEGDIRRGTQTDLLSS